MVVHLLAQAHGTRREVRMNRDLICGGGVMGTILMTIDEVAHASPRESGLIDRAGE